MWWHAVTRSARACANWLAARWRATRPSNLSNPLLSSINPEGVHKMTCSKSSARRKFGIKPAVLCALALPAALALVPAAAKTLVFCSEGSPENFYPAVNTTGTSFDANSQIYSRLVDFERGGTAVVPGLAERWSVSPDGKE